MSLQLFIIHWDSEDDTILVMHLCKWFSRIFFDAFEVITVLKTDCIIWCILWRDTLLFDFQVIFFTVEHGSFACLRSWLVTSLLFCPLLMLMDTVCVGDLWRLAHVLLHLWWKIQLHLVDMDQDSRFNRTTLALFVEEYSLILGKKAGW